MHRIYNCLVRECFRRQVSWPLNSSHRLSWDESVHFHEYPQLMVCTLPFASKRTISAYLFPSCSNLFVDRNRVNEGVIMNHENAPCKYVVHHQSWMIRKDEFQVWSSPCLDRAGETNHTLVDSVDEVSTYVITSPRCFWYGREGDLGFLMHCMYNERHGSSPSSKRRM